MIPYRSSLSDCNARRGCFAILAPLRGRIASTMVRACAGVYSPSGITYGSPEIPSSLELGEESLASAASLSSFKRGDVLIVLLPDDDRPTRPLLLLCLPKAAPNAEDDAVANGGGDVKGSRYSLAMANGIMAVGAAVRSAEDITGSIAVLMLDVSLLRSRLILEGGTISVGSADPLVPEGLLLSLSSLFTLLWVLIISTSPEAVLPPSASSDEVVVVAVRPAVVTVVLSLFSLSGFGSMEGCWYLSAIMEEGGEKFPNDPSSSSSSTTPPFSSFTTPSKNSRYTFISFFILNLNNNRSLHI
mmetsp:Transcript_12429/g.22500  ORF Transcript_12429/g.22500 Transcript_12429/m.22500 type:complete len:301 (-) Transcript_12429:440-1342(-)